MLCVFTHEEKTFHSSRSVTVDGRRPCLLEARPLKWILMLYVTTCVQTISLGSTPSDDRVCEELFVELFQCRNDLRLIASVDVALP